MQFDCRSSEGSPDRRSVRRRKVRAPLGVPGPGARLAARFNSFIRLSRGAAVAPDGPAMRHTVGPIPTFPDKRLSYLPQGPVTIFNRPPTASRSRKIRLNFTARGYGHLLALLHLAQRSVEMAGSAIGKP